MSAAVGAMGDEIRLTASAYEAVLVCVGAGLRTLRHRGRDVIDGYGPGEPCPGSRGQLLAPWPNRISEGSYEFDGQRRQLDLSEPERRCAIHGLVRWATWDVIEHTDDRAVLCHRLHAHPGYPHVLDMRVEYRLSASEGLTTSVTARNIGAQPAPYAAGAHPYLTVGLDTIDECDVLIPADSWLATDHRGIPTGRVSVAGTPFDFTQPRLLGDLIIDHAFSDFARSDSGRATVTLREPASGVESSLWVDTTIAWIEIFTGDTLDDRARRGLGVEPMTCAPDGFNNKQGLVKLRPGHQHVATWGIRAETPDNVDPLDAVATIG